MDPGRPPARSDNRSRVTIDLSPGDVPMIAAALRTASCEALANGRADARARLDRYRAMLETAIPEPARVFDGMVWAEICAALDGASDYAVGFEDWGWRPGGEKQGVVLVSVGANVWRSADFRNGRDAVEAVASAIEAMAPIGATRGVRPDTLARHLRPMPPPPAPAAEDDPPDGYSP